MNLAQISQACRQVNFDAVSRPVIAPDQKPRVGASGNSGQVSSVVLRSVPQMERPMSLEQNKQVALESFRVIETGDSVAAVRIIAPDFINLEADDDPDPPDRGSEPPQA
jgi:hypothetical protein